MSRTNIGEIPHTPPKSTFLFHKTWSEDIERLSDYQAGKLIKLIVKYANGEPEPLQRADTKLRLLFLKITTQIDRDRSKYNPRTGRYHWNYKGEVSAKQLKA